MALLPGLIDGPPAQPQRGGLVNSALPGNTGVDWFKGVQWWPEDVAGWRLAADCTDSTVGVGNVDLPRPVVTQPFVIQTNVKGPKSTRMDLSARAERRIRAITSQAMARELWLGEMAQAAPFTLLGGQDFTNVSVGGGQFVSPYLTWGSATDAGGGSALEPLAAMAAVEDALSDVVAGGPTYLHVPRGIVTELAQELVRVGDTITTFGGSIVVTDQGYPSVNDAGGGAIYGTGPVMCWVGDITIYDNPSTYVDVSDNSMELWVERPTMAVFDPVTLTSCAVSV